MQYSIAQEIFGSPWHMEASFYQRYLPLVNGMFTHNLEFTIESEPQDNVPFLISQQTGDVVAQSDEEDESMREKVVYVMPIRGVMTKHDQECGPRGTRTLANRLLRADADRSVIGHILIFETGGGSANSVPELAEAIQRCTKPVLAYVDGFMCSAGMYAGSYCKEIWANRDTDIVGSIGTMIVYQGRKQKSEANMLGDIQVTVYADEAFEKNEEYESAINNFDFKLVKEKILNPHNKQFIDDIKANLDGVEDKHLHGATFHAKEVIGALVHKIGSFDEAIQRVVELSEDQNEGNEGGSNQNDNSNSINMKQFPKINGLLGVDSMESQDDQVSLNEEQLEAINTALEAGAQAQTDLAAEQSAHQTTTNSLQEANQQIENLQGGAGANTPPTPKVVDQEVSEETDDLFDAAQSANELFNSLPE